jgi:hypothetical protein
MYLIARHNGIDYFGAGGMSHRLAMTIIQI